MNTTARHRLRGRGQSGSVFNGMTNLIEIGMGFDHATTLYYTTQPRDQVVRMARTTRHSSMVFFSYFEEMDLNTIYM